MLLSRLLLSRLMPSSAILSASLAVPLPILRTSFPNGKMRLLLMERDSAICTASLTIAACSTVDACLLGILLYFGVVQFCIVGAQQLTRVLIWSRIQSMMNKFGVTVS